LQGGRKRRCKTERTILKNPGKKGMPWESKQGGLARARDGLGLVTSQSGRWYHVSEDKGSRENRGEAVANIAGCSEKLGEGAEGRINITSLESENKMSTLHGGENM